MVLCSSSSPALHGLEVLQILRQEKMKDTIIWAIGPDLPDTDPSLPCIGLDQEFGFGPVGYNQVQA